MTTNEKMIKHVSDTSIWVAQFRADETDRPDALFKDSLAKKLVGIKGKQIVQSMHKTAKMTSWVVITRTLIIDRFILNAISEGVDTIVNLGAGLDTRPYRMNLPANLNWIEADFNHVIEFKNLNLKDDKPICNLERYPVDLSVDSERLNFLEMINKKGKKILVLTEGVIPYLTESQVSHLAKDLYIQNNIHFWLAEYLNSRVYPYLQTQYRKEKLINAPFQFFPKDWISFFQSNKWSPLKINYSAEESEKVGRPMPIPVIFKFIRLFLNEKRKTESKRMSGFMLLHKL